MSDKEFTLSYFQNFLTDNKIELFNKVVLNRTKHFTLILEDLFHPHNASAVIRTCDCFGIQDLHMIENRHQFVNEKDISLGSTKWIDIHHHRSASKTSTACFDNLREKGYTIAALSPHKKDMLIDEYPIENKTAFVLGAEKNGLSESTLNNADVFVKIPMYGFTESYNVSVSAAMVLHNLVQRMRASELDWSLDADEQWFAKLSWTLKSIRSSSAIVRHFIEEYPDKTHLFPFENFSKG